MGKCFLGITARDKGRILGVMNNMSRFINWLRGLFSRTPVRLAIVRRYADANGHYVGELYLHSESRTPGTFAIVSAYKMIGVSLDSLPLELRALSLADDVDALDLKNDFLAPMMLNTLRVGAAEPKDNDNVRKMIGRLPRRNIRFVIQNKFIEHVMERKST